MSSLTKDVINKGFKYYDWNLSSGDAAGGRPTAEDIKNNVINNLRKDRANMILMHDIKTYTRDALRDIIKYAKENGYDFFTTTLSVSPHKNSKMINEIGYNLEEKYSMPYLYSDFKKRDGYKRSIVLSKKYNLYRQDYCGCKYSIRNL